MTAALYMPAVSYTHLDVYKRQDRSMVLYIFSGIKDVSALTWFRVIVIIILILILLIITLRTIQKSRQRQAQRLARQRERQREQQRQRQREQNNRRRY